VARYRGRCGGHVRRDNSGDLHAIDIERTRDTFGLIAVRQQVSVEKALQRLVIEVGARSQRMLRNSFHIALQPQAKRFLTWNCRQIHLFDITIDYFGERVHRITISVLEAPRQRLVKNIRMEIDSPRIISEGYLSFHGAIKKLYGKWHLFGG
jgi:hypothetical protein